MLSNLPIETPDTDLSYSFCTNGSNRRDSKDLERDKYTGWKCESHGGKLVVEHHMYRVHNLDGNQLILLGRWNAGILVTSFRLL